MYRNKVRAVEPMNNRIVGVSGAKRISAVQVTHFGPHPVTHADQVVYVGGMSERNRQLTGGFYLSVEGAKEMRDALNELFPPD